jgi:hypothetical protein
MFECAVGAQVVHGVSAFAVALLLLGSSTVYVLLVGVVRLAIPRAPKNRNNRPHLATKEL